VRYHRKYLTWRADLKNKEDYLRLLSAELIAFIDDLVETGKREAAGRNVLPLTLRPHGDTVPMAEVPAEQTREV
jgi:hypothetical protein